MKKLFLMVCLIGTMGMLFTACTKENEPNDGSGDVDNKEYVSMENLGKAESKFLIVNYYGLETSGTEDIDVLLYAGITKEEVDNMDANSIIEEDVFILYMDVGTSQKEYIPTGVYPVRTEENRQVGTICDIRIQHFPAGSGLASKPNVYPITEGALEVRYDNGIYRFNFNGKGSNGDIVVADFTGTAHYFDRAE